MSITVTQPWSTLSYPERQDYLSESHDRLQMVWKYYQNLPDSRDSRFALYLARYTSAFADAVVEQYSCTRPDAEDFLQEQFLRKLDWMKDYLKKQIGDMPKDYADTALVCSMYTLADFTYGDRKVFSLSGGEILNRLQNVLAKEVDPAYAEADPFSILMTTIDYQYSKATEDSTSHLFFLNEADSEE